MAKKRRAEPATAAAIAEVRGTPAKIGGGTKAPAEERRSRPSERTLWGARRRGLAPTPVGTRAVPVWIGPPLSRPQGKRQRILQLVQRNWGLAENRCRRVGERRNPQGAKPPGTGRTRPWAEGPARIYPGWLSERERMWSLAPVSTRTSILRACATLLWWDLHRQSHTPDTRRPASPNKPLLYHLGQRILWPACSDKRGTGTPFPSPWAAYYLARRGVPRRSGATKSPSRSKLKEQSRGSVTPSLKTAWEEKRTKTSRSSWKAKGGKRRQE